MTISQIFAWRLYIWFTLHAKQIALGFRTFLLLTIFIVLGLGLYTFSHEVVFAQSTALTDQGEPPLQTAQHIDGFVASTHVRPAPRRQHISMATKLQHEQLTSPGSDIVKTIPIIMYHKTPDDFEIQMNELAAKSYTTITMRSASRILRGLEDGPAKPVVITFDDGFDDQMKAIDILARYQYRATFYIIIGGPLSDWCIGLERKKTDCGDSYLTWPQIESIAHSPLVEIGAHTLDHPDLPSLSELEQIHQIVATKQILEDRLGLEVTTFAYPYGRYTPQIAEKVQSAGYTSAVTTIGGVEQNSHKLFELRRVRNTYQLP